MRRVVSAARLCVCVCVCVCVCAELLTLLRELGIAASLDVAYEAYQAGGLKDFVSALHAGITARAEGEPG